MSGGCGLWAFWSRPGPRYWGTERRRARSTQLVSAVVAPFFALSVACSSSTPPPHEPDSSAVEPTAPEAVETDPVETELGEPPASEKEDVGVKTLFVHEKRAACEGEYPKECLQVRETEQDEWTYFYDDIAGFEHEESYRYELRVEVEELESPPLDRTSHRYRLIEVVSKEKVD